MTEIRNLTRNGQTFYPQTHIEAVLDPEGEYIGNYLENPEFVYVKTDKEDKVLEGIQQDGTKVIGGDLLVDGDAKVIGETEIGCASYKVVESPEWIRVVVDSEDKILCGIRQNGKFFADLDGVDEQVKELIQPLMDEVEELVDRFDEIFKLVENPEFVDVKTDSEDKILEAIRNDGTKVIPAGIEFNGNKIYSFSDPERRHEMTVDEEQKVISYRKNDGTLVENAGITSSRIDSDDVDAGHINAGLLEVEDIEMSETVKYKISQLDSNNYKPPYLPKYGYANIKTETFYLTSDDRINTINDVYYIQDYEESIENAAERISIGHYYIKSTLTDNRDGTYSINENSVRLVHYAASKVSLNSEDNKFYAKDPIRKVNGVCYYADSLGFNSSNERVKVLEGYTRIAPFDPDLAEGAAKNSLVEVKEFTGPVNVGAWSISDYDIHVVPGTDIGKKPKHKCICDVNFGDFYSKNNNAIEIAYQGNSTQSREKRNFRFTFYKKNDFGKKDKIKFGEMLRLSGYNLKANYVDSTRVQELILYRLFIQIWQNRPITDRYDWDNKVNGYYHGATGLIQGFPIRLDIQGDFYGIYIFGLKKDEKNYMLGGDDEDGLFLSGSGPDNIDWAKDMEYFSPELAKEYFDDEMLDEVSESTAEAMSKWIEYLNDRLYIGSDKNYYPKHFLTEVNGVMYVTDTLVDGQVVEGSISSEKYGFTKEHNPERIDVLGFIDYLICAQVFITFDNTFSNMLFYSGKEKTKIYPFFYDLDLTGYIYAPFEDIFTREARRNMYLWERIRDMYWDEIVNRYCYLRKTYLNIDTLKAICEDVVDNIPSSDFENESVRWNKQITSFYDNLDRLAMRFDFLDSEFFKIR